MAFQKLVMVFLTASSRAAFRAKRFLDAWEGGWRMKEHEKRNTIIKPWNPSFPSANLDTRSSHAYTTNPTFNTGSYQQSPKVGGEEADDIPRPIEATDTRDPGVRLYNATQRWAGYMPNPATKLAPKSYLR